MKNIFDTLNVDSTEQEQPCHSQTVEPVSSKVETPSNLQRNCQVNKNLANLRALVAKRRNSSEIPTEQKIISKPPSKPDKLVDRLPFIRTVKAKPHKTSATSPNELNDLVLTQEFMLGAPNQSMIKYGLRQNLEPYKFVPEQRSQDKNETKNDANLESLRRVNRKRSTNPQLLEKYLTAEPENSQIVVSNGEPTPAEDSRPKNSPGGESVFSSGLLDGFLQLAQQLPSGKSDVKPDSVACLSAEDKPGVRPLPGTSHDLKFDVLSYTKALNAALNVTSPRKLSTFKPKELPDIQPPEFQTENFDDTFQDLYSTAEAGSSVELEETKPVVKFSKKKPFKATDENEELYMEELVEICRFWFPEISTDDPNDVIAKVHKFFVWFRLAQ